MLESDVLDYFGYSQFEFIEYIGKLKKFFRVNTLKTSFTKFMEIKDIDCCPSLVENVCEYMGTKKIGNTWEYFSGLIHPQSLSSALIPTILNPKPGDTVLDIAAAPGSKTTQMAAMMENKGAIIANDKRGRLPSLFHNISRLSVLNVAPVSFDAKHLPFNLREKFSKVLVDVPCSALGSHAYTWKRTNQSIIKTLSSVQKKIILSGFDALKPLGYMVYSTCTITKEENEDVISFLIEKRPNARLVPIELNVPHERGIDMREAIRIFPWHFDSEAFFAALILKVD